MFTITLQANDFIYNLLNRHYHTIMSENKTKPYWKTENLPYTLARGFLSWNPFKCIDAAKIGGFPLGFWFAQQETTLMYLSSWYLLFIWLNNEQKYQYGLNYKK
jgi:putative solute:sodium symporter small subunit